ncbi:MAG TPA: hypothetical protein VI818_01800 [Candidatus Thermoplasmatota archaeon]|nr:hypothetical protein [Candidatus Thermoplasmatota archaeon]
MRLAQRTSAAVAAALAILAPGCVDVSEAPLSFAGHKGQIGVAASFDGPWWQLEWINSGVTFTENGSAGPDARFVSWGEYKPSRADGVFGTVPETPPAVLDGPSPVKGAKPVLTGRGTFVTEWPEDFGGGYLMQMKNWTWDAFFAVVEDPKAGDPYSAHMFLSYDASAMGGFQIPAIRTTRDLDGANNVNLTFPLTTLLPGSPIPIQARLLSGERLSDLEVRVVGGGKTVASQRLGGAAATAAAQMVFVPLEGTAYEVHVAGRAVAARLSLVGGAALPTPALHFYWDDAKPSGR